MTSFISFSKRRLRQIARFRPRTVGRAMGLSVWLAAAPAVAQGPIFLTPPGCPCGPPAGVPWVVGEIVTPVPTAPLTTTACRPLARDCNLALEVTEEFANRIVGRSDRRCGPVRDFVLGADVYGDQATTTRSWLDFRPCDAAARVELVVAGEVESRTIGVTPQAQVQSLGRHLFELRKEIEFDGAQLRTRSPAATVTPRQRNVAAVTQAAGVPVLGPIANSIALQAADARNPQAAAITADRITRQAAPQFNDRVDAELARLNQLLSDRVTPQLRQWELLPTSQLVSTTEDSLQWCLTLPAAPVTNDSAPLWNGPNLSGGGGGPPSIPASLEAAPDGIPCVDHLETRVHGRAATVFLHESLVNGLLDRLPLAGVGIPDAAIDRWFTALASGAGLSELSHGEGPIEPRLATIVFDRRHPIRLRFDEGRFELIVRMGITPVTGPQISMQEITIPFTVELAGDDVRFTPAEVTIAPADPGAPSGVIDEAARAVIRQQIQGRLEERSVPRKVPLRVPDSSPTTLQVRDVTLHRGWLTVALD